MSLKQSLGCVVLLFVTFASADSPSSVVELTAFNFDSKVASNPDHAWLIKFYAPWCTHCNKMAPAYEEVAKNLLDSDAKVIASQVDGSKERGLLERFNIQRFPTIILLQGDNMYTFKGAATYEAMSSFARGGYTELKPSDTPNGFKWKMLAQVAGYVSIVEGLWNKAVDEYNIPRPALVGGLVVALFAGAALFVVVLVVVAEKLCCRDEDDYSPVNQHDHQD